MAVDTRHSGAHAGAVPVSYVGVPFLDHGRDMGGFDCWGLVWHYLTHEGGMRGLDSHSETSARDMMAIATLFDDAAASTRWRSIEQSNLHRFDVVQMWTWEKYQGKTIKGRRHVGVMVDDARMMHVEEGISTVVVPIARMGHRLVAFWRYQDER